MKFLSSSLLIARVRGMEIRLHFSLLFSLLITYFIFRPYDLRGLVLAGAWLVAFIFSVFLHELGHAITARLAGIEVKSIVIWLLGGMTNLTRKAEKPTHNLAIYAAGPMVNMLLGFGFVVAYILSVLFVPRGLSASVFLWVQTFNEFCISLALLNVILVVFNLLPVYPLDGGNVLHSLMELFFGRSNADWITMAVSIPVLLCLVAFGIATRDYILLASCLLIAIGVGTLNRSTLRYINLGLNYLFRRSGYYYLQGDYERAAQIFTKNIDREPGQANHYIARAACYLSMLQTQRALADVERALRLAPNNPVALQLRGEMYVMDKNYDAALELFARAQTLNPHWAVPYFDRGSVYFDQRSFPAALAEFDKAISMLGNFPLFFVLRSLTQFVLGNVEASHKDQDSALRLSDRDSLVMSELNQTIYEGYLNWAEDYYARAISKYPRSSFAYHGRADAYRANKEYEKAIADYTRAIELDPREPIPYIGRGKCYNALGQMDKARADLEKVRSVTDKLHLIRQADELLRRWSSNDEPLRSEERIETSTFKEQP